MKALRRLTAVLAAAVMTMLMAACNNESSDDSGGGDSRQVVATYVAPVDEEDNQTWGRMIFYSTGIVEKKYSHSGLDLPMVFQGTYTGDPTTAGSTITAESNKLTYGGEEPIIKGDYFSNKTATAEIREHDGKLYLVGTDTDDDGDDDDYQSWWFVRYNGTLYFVPTDKLYLVGYTSEEIEEARRYDAEKRENNRNRRSDIELWEAGEYDKLPVKM